MSWGSSPWGSSPWGAGVASVTVTRAYPVDRRVVRVHFSAAVLASSLLGDGDALNATTWSVTELDAFGAAARELQVAVVGEEAAGRTFDVRTIEALAPWPTTHRLAFTTLRDASGGALVPPTTIEFTGVGLALAATAGVVDLLNADVRGAAPMGGLVASSAGGYELHGGSELLRKIVVRRLSTPLGAFLHLPRFGLDLRAKEPVRSVSRLQAEVLNQLRQESDLDQVQATVRLDPATRVVTIEVRARIVATREVVSTTVGASE